MKIRSRLLTKIRQQNGNCRNAAAIQFATSYKKLFCLSYMDNSSGANNCFGDFDDMLFSLKSNNREQLQVLFQESTVRIPLNVNTTDYRKLKQETGTFGKLYMLPNNFHHFVYIYETQFSNLSKKYSTVKNVGKLFCF